MMSKTVAAFYGLLAGGITASAVANAIWFATLLGALFAAPAAVRRVRDRKRGESQ